MLNKSHLDKPSEAGGGTDHTHQAVGDGGLLDELRLTPKASSTGPEGTIFYDMDDDHIYVATE